MSEVEYNEKNYRHCRCNVCPVQLINKCAKEKIREYGEFSKAEKSQIDAAKLYCSIGKSNCPKLRKFLPCLCPTCLVWYENNLGSVHYCTKGRKA